eukprot:g38921.t1
MRVQLGASTSTSIAVAVNNKEETLNESFGMNPHHEVPEKGSGHSGLPNWTGRTVTDSKVELPYSGTVIQELLLRGYYSRLNSVVQD